MRKTFCPAKMWEYSIKIHKNCGHGKRFPIQFIIIIFPCWGRLPTSLPFFLSQLQAGIHVNVDWDVLINGIKDRGRFEKLLLFSPTSRNLPSFWWCVEGMGAKQFQNVIICYVYDYDIGWCVLSLEHLTTQSIWWASHPRSPLNWCRFCFVRNHFKWND